MCYSALIWAGFQEYVRRFGAVIDIEEFVRLYTDKGQSQKIKTLKGMDDALAASGESGLVPVREAIREWQEKEVARLEQELFKQRKRLADAERILQSRTTKKALDDQRIATDKVEWLKSKLGDLRRTETKERDRRIFPGLYCPLMVWEDGHPVIKPMRYQCRPAGRPAFYDTRYPGTYNARRDNLEGFWKGQFGHSHGLVIFNAFYENVARHAAEGRTLRDGEQEENVVLEFGTKGGHDMLVACLWSQWEGDGERLLSFAAITDEPPVEVAAAGHDRCIIPIREANLEAWLNPVGASLKALHAILDDRDRPYFEHRMAA